MIMMTAAATSTTITLWTVGILEVGIRSGGSETVGAVTPVCFRVDCKQQQRRHQQQQQQQPLLLRQQQPRQLPRQQQPLLPRQLPQQPQQRRRLLEG